MPARVCGTHFPVGSHYGDPAEAIPPRPQESHHAPVAKRSEPPKLTVAKRPKSGSPRLHKAEKKQRLARRRVVFVVANHPNNQPTNGERRRFLDRLGVAVIVIAVGLFGGGCATPGGAGFIVTSTTTPLCAPGVGNGPGTKVGVATQVNVLGLVAVGNGGIRRAMKEGRITTVHSVDVRRRSAFGLFATETVVVSGE